MKFKLVWSILFVFFCQNMKAMTAHAQEPVDLTLWNVKSYPAPPGQANWEITTSSARETSNGWPTLLYSDFPALWTALEVDVAIETDSDNDYIGFAVGFQPGDTSNSSAEYLLIDWKQYHQGYDFPSPSCTPGVMANTGMAVSQVSGVPTADEFWGHCNFDAPCSDLSNGLQELGRANNLGDVGWWRWTPIHFRFEYTPTTLRVYVDDQLEIDLTGTFGQGRWAFYDFSQEQAYFTEPTIETLLLPVDVEIKPEILNLKSNGVFTAFIELPEGYGEEDVESVTLKCEGEEVPAVKTMMADDGRLIIKFDRAEMDLGDVSSGDVVELILTGLLDGTVFIGSDTITVIYKGR